MFYAEDVYVVFLQICYSRYTREPQLGGLVAILAPHVVVSTKYEAVWIVMFAMNVVQLRNSSNATSVARSTLAQSMCVSITKDGIHLLLMKNTSCVRGTDSDLCKLTVKRFDYIIPWLKLVNMCSEDVIYCNLWAASDKGMLITENITYFAERCPCALGRQFVLKKVLDYDPLVAW